MLGTIASAEDPLFRDQPMDPRRTDVVEDVSKLPPTPRDLRDAVLAGDPGCVFDPELFTGPADIEPEDELAEDREARIAVAREVCAACPVRLACLAYTLWTRPADGVWAGFTAEEIAALLAAALRPASATPSTVVRLSTVGRRRSRQSGLTPVSC